MNKMKNVLNNFKGLDPREIWMWPTLPRSLVLMCISLFVIGGLYFTIISSELDLLTQSQEKHASLRKEYADKFVLAANLDKYKALRAETEKVFGALLRQLPNKSEMEALLNDINNAGVGRGLIFELFKPEAKENMFDFYAELPITMEVEGTYHDVGEFNSAIAHLARIVTINDLELSLSPVKAGANAGALNSGLRMKMKAIAKTFRYLDEAEIKAQKKAKDAAKKSGKGGNSADEKGAK